MAEVDEQTGVSLEGFETQAETQAPPIADTDTGISLEGFETAPDNIPAVTNIDEKKMNDSLQFSRELNISPSQAFDMHDSIVKQKEERQKVESLKYERTKIALNGKTNVLTNDAKAILDGSAAVDPFGIRGLVESSLSVGAGVASWLFSFPVGMNELINQATFGEPLDFSKIRDAMEGVQELPGEFEALQPKTLSGQQWANIASFPFQVFHERGVEPMAEWAADKFGNTDENKEDIRDAVRIMGDAGLLIAPVAVKKGKAKIFKSDFYRKATVSERGRVILDYEDLRAKGYTEGELARMKPEFFELSLEKRKATMVDAELARVEEKPVEQVVRERERAELVKSKEPEALERVAEIDKEIKGIVEPEITPDQALEQKAIGIPSAEPRATDVKTGQPFKGYFVHNPEKAPRVPENRFGQDFEPSGKYVNVISKNAVENIPNNLEGGIIEFENPLVLENVSPGPEGWKKTVMDMYDGKTGKELTKALIEDGFDGIITTESKRNFISEVVSLKKETTRSLTEISITKPTAKKEVEPLSEFPTIEEAPELVPVIEKLKAGDESALAELREIADERGARIFDVLGNNLVEITEAYKPLLPKVNAMNAEFRAKAEAKAVSTETNIGDINNPVMQIDQARSIDNVPESCGKCYELSGKKAVELGEKSKLMIVEVTNPNNGKTVGHGLVEVEGKIYDPQTDTYWNKDLYFETYKVKEIYSIAGDKVDAAASQLGFFPSTKSVPSEEFIIRASEVTAKKEVDVIPEKPVEISAKEVDAIIEGKSELTEKFEVKPIEIPKEVKETKGVKKRVRLLTGQRKISDLVTEESALKESFRQAQKAARKAFREGNKEGVAKENLRLKELATRSKARKEASSEVRKMIKNLKKVQKNLDKFHPSFKEPINDLIEGIDLVRLGGTKKLRLQNLSDLIDKEFVNQVELSDNTVSQLRRLDKFNVGDMTFDDLNEIHDAVMHLTHLNKLKNEIIVNQKVRKFNEVLTETVAEMKPPKEVAKGIVSSQPGAFKKTRDIGRLIKDTFGIRHDAYDLIIESIAGLNSTIEQVLFQAVDVGTDVMITHKRKTYEKFQSDLEGFSQRHGVDDIANWLDEPVTVDDFRFTRNERMELYNHSLNPDNRTAIIEGGFGFRTSDTPDVIYSMTESEMNKIVDSLTPAEKEFASKPVRNLFEDQREALNGVFIKRNNYAMPDIENYYPKDVMPIGRKIDDAFLESETALDSLKGQFTRVGINKDHLRARVGSVAPLYINGLTNTLNKSIAQSSAYVGLEIPMANASKLLYNKEFRNELITRYDRITWQEIEKGLRDIAGDYKSYSTVETLMLRTKNNIATAFLGLNPFVMAKQVISLPIYMTYVQPDFLMQGAMDYMNNTAEIKARHSLYSPKWFERTEGGFSRDVADVFKSGGEKRLFKGKKTIQESTMAGIQLFDEAAVGPGMQGAVLQAISEFQKGKLSAEVKQATNIKDSDIKNLSPEEKMVLAYKFADFATVRTQPMFSPQNRSSLQRGTPLEVLATMFGSFTNRALNLLRRTYRESRRDGSPEASAKFARALFTVMVINSLSVTAIDSIRDKMRGKEITPGNILTRILTSWTGYFFFLRDIASAISSSLISGNRYSGFDVQLPIQRPVNMTKDVALEGIDLIQAMADNDSKKAEEAALRFIDSGIGLALMTKGIPYETPKRFVQDLAGFNKKDKKVKRSKVQRRK